MEIIKDDSGLELAQILSIMDYSLVDGFSFFSVPEESLQVGSILFKKGSAVEPHIHRSKEVDTAYPIVELILILNGCAEIDIYDEGKKLVLTVTAAIGTIVLLKRGGHGFHFPQCDTRLLDVRCGPYTDKKHDKEMI